jgi:hypothetical protein
VNPHELKTECFRGTSAAAGLWAGMIALTNQQQAASVGVVGFSNPRLYSFASAGQATYGANFHDVQTGDNNVWGMNLYHATRGYDLTTGLGSPTCVGLYDLSTQASPPGTSLSAIVDVNTGTVTAYVPNGNWNEKITGVTAFAVEGSPLGVDVTKVPIATPFAINTCSGNSLTGDVVCTANDKGPNGTENDVYIIHGTAIAQALATAANGPEYFSGGGCTTCNVAVDALRNKAHISIGTASGSAAFQTLDLGASPPALGPPVPVGQHNTSEDIAIDSASGFVLSPNEQGVYQLYDPSPLAPKVYNFTPTYGGELDGAAMDSTTGILVASVEFTDKIFLADLKQATFSGTPWGTPYQFSGTTWQAPSQFQSVPEFGKMGAGTCGIAVAPNSHLGVVTGEFGTNTVGVIQLPSSSGPSAGTPAIQRWAAAPIPRTPDGRIWEMGLDPHTMTAYTSPTNGKPYAIIQDHHWGEAPSYLAIIDLQALLDLPRANDGTQNVRDPLVWCQGPGVNGTPAVANCVVRFVGSNP